MPDALLITKADFASHIELPESLDFERLAPHVRAVQERRVKAALGADLYAELVRRLAATPPETSPAWESLHNAVRPMLACAALARYLSFAQVTPTSHSLVVKAANSSTPADPRSVAAMGKVLLDDALGYETDLRCLLGATPAFAPWLGTTCGSAPRPAGSSTVTVAVGRRGSAGYYF